METLMATVEQAEQLLAMKNFEEARRMADGAVKSACDDIRALLVRADSNARLNALTQAEDDYRRILDIAAANTRAMYGLAWVLRKAQRHEEALPLLEGVLAQQPTDATALELLCDVLAALQRVPEAEMFLNAALDRASSNPRLQLLRGEWLVRSGRGEEGVAHFQGMLARKYANPGVWLALMRAAEVRGDYDEAIGLAEQAVQASPDVFWLWSRQLLMLSAAGREEELQRKLNDRPPPAPGNPDFLAWSGLMKRLEVPSRIHAAMARDPAKASAELCTTKEGLLLLAELSRDSGDAMGAVQHLAVASALDPGDSGTLRSLFYAAVCAGDIALCERTASALHRTNPRKHGGLPIHLLHEVRIFGSAVARVNDIVRNGGAAKLELLSQVLVEEPGCIPLSMAWLAQFAAVQLRERPALRSGGLIPKVLFFAGELQASWGTHHPQYQLVDLENADNLRSATALLPAQAAVRLRRHAWDAKVDILRLTALHALGGWSIHPSSAVDGEVARLAGGSARLVMTLADNFQLGPVPLGAVAGHEVTREALEVALTAVDEVAPLSNASHMITGSPAVSIGASVALARQVVSGIGLNDVLLISAAQKNRLLGLAWPK
jgi:tetratricopeptide (TPR) repeat protein